MDDVDVRLLVPNGTDIPILRPLSKAGYRPLLGPGCVCLIGKAQCYTPRPQLPTDVGGVGSSNLNIASWLSNCELDAMVENESFAHEMEKCMFRT